MIAAKDNSIPIAAMRESLLTVLIPTFNGQATIERALSSVISEIELGGLEKLVKVIVANNCSIDSTELILERIVSEKNYIWITKTDENIGLDNNLSTAVGFVATKFFKVLCDDDILMPGYLSHLLSIIENNQDVDLIVSSMQALQNDKDYPVIREPRKITKFKDHEGFIETTNGAYGQLSTLCFRTSSWLESENSPLLSDYRYHGMEFIARFYHVAALGVCIFDDSLLMGNDDGTKRWYGSFLDVFKINCSHMSFVFQMDCSVEKDLPNLDKWRNWIKSSKKSMTRQLIIDVITLRRINVSVKSESVLKYVPTALKNNSLFLCFATVVEFTPKWICTLITRLLFVLRRFRNKWKGR